MESGQLINESINTLEQIAAKIGEGLQWHTCKAQTLLRRAQALRQHFSYFSNNSAASIRFEATLPAVHSFICAMLNLINNISATDSHRNIWRNNTIKERFASLNMELHSLLLRLDPAMVQHTVADAEQDAVDSAADLAQLEQVVAQILTEDNTPPEEIDVLLQELRVFESRNVAVQGVTLSSTTSDENDHEEVLDTLESLRSNDGRRVLPRLITIDRDQLTLNETDLLGRGSFGKVYSGWLNGTTEVAVKIVNEDADVSRDVSAELRREAITMQIARHSGIIDYLGAQLESVPRYIVMERAVCSLFDALHRQTDDTPRYRQYRQTLFGTAQNEELLSLKVSLMRQVSTALQYLHSLGIIHRDIKSHNILVTAQGALKITDFGLARMKHATSATRSTVSGAAQGTPVYMAPEVLIAADDSRPVYSNASDVYAYGVLLNEVLTTQIPFVGLSQHAVYVKLLQGLRPELFGAKLPRSYPLYGLVLELQGVIASSWHADAASRPTFSAISTTLGFISSALEGARITTQAAKATATLPRPPPAPPMHPLHPHQQSLGQGGGGSSETQTLHMVLPPRPPPFLVSAQPMQVQPKQKWRREPTGNTDEDARDEVQSSGPESYQSWSFEPSPPHGSGNGGNGGGQHMVSVSGLATTPLYGGKYPPETNTTSGTSSSSSDTGTGTGDSGKGSTTPGQTSPPPPPSVLSLALSELTVADVGVLLDLSELSDLKPVFSAKRISGSYLTLCVSEVDMQECGVSGSLQARVLLSKIAEWRNNGIVGPLAEGIKTSRENAAAAAAGVATPMTAEAVLPQQASSVSPVHIVPDQAYRFMEELKNTDDPAGIMGIADEICSREDCLDYHHFTPLSVAVFDKFLALNGKQQAVIGQLGFHACLCQMIDGLSSNDDNDDSHSAGDVSAQEEESAAEAAVVSVRASVCGRGLHALATLYKTLAHAFAGNAALTRIALVVCHTVRRALIAFGRSSAEVVRQGFIVANLVCDATTADVVIESSLQPLLGYCFKQYALGNKNIASGGLRLTATLWRRSTAEVLTPEFCDFLSSVASAHIADADTVMNGLYLVAVMSQGQPEAADMLGTAGWCELVGRAMERYLSINGRVMRDALAAIGGLSVLADNRPRLVQAKAFDVATDFLSREKEDAKPLKHSHLLLHAAIDVAHPGCVSALLKKRHEPIRTESGAVVQPVDMPDKNGQTPLLKAIHGRNEPLLRTLLSRQVDANIPRVGDTPLKVAFTTGQREMVRLLLERNVHSPQSTADPNAPVLEDGATLLMRACEVGDADLVRWLLAAGANPSTPNLTGLRPHNVAVASKRDDILSLLTKDNAMPLAVTGGDSATTTVDSLAADTQCSFLIRKPAVPVGHTAQYTVLYLSSHIGTSPVHFFVLFEQWCDEPTADYSGVSTSASDDQPQEQAQAKAQTPPPLQRHVIHKIHLVDGRIQVDRYTRLAEECDRQLRQAIFGADMQYTASSSSSSLSPLLLKPRYYAATIRMKPQEANQKLAHIKSVPTSSTEPLWPSDFAVLLQNVGIYPDFRWSYRHRGECVVLAPYDVLRFESREQLGRARSESIAVGGNAVVNPLTLEVTSPVASQIDTGSFQTALNHSNDAHLARMVYFDFHDGITRLYSPEDMTAVMHAAAAPDCRLLTVIVANPHTRDCVDAPSERGKTEGMTAVHVAARQPDSKALRYLIHKARPDPAVADRCGNLPLHFAVKSGSVENVNELLGYAHFAANPPRQNHLGQTPLHLAVAGRYADIVAVLLQRYPADAKLCDEMGRTPLSFVENEEDDDETSKAIAQLLRNAVQRHEF